MEQYYWDFTHLLCWLITSRLSPVRHTLPDWSNTTPIRHTLSDGEASAFIKAGLGRGQLASIELQFELTKVIYIALAAEPALHHEVCWNGMVFIAGTL